MLKSHCVASDRKTAGHLHSLLSLSGYNVGKAPILWLLRVITLVQRLFCMEQQRQSFRRTCETKCRCWSIKNNSLNKCYNAIIYTCCFTFSIGKDVSLHGSLSVIFLMIVSENVTQEKGISIPHSYQYFPFHARGALATARDLGNGVETDH